MLTHVGTRRIETERLVLRPFTPSDAEGMLWNWAGDERVQSNYGEPTYGTLEAVQELLGRYLEGYGKPETYRWAIDAKGGGTCIGQIAFFLVDSKNHFAEIEYCVGTAFQGKGYATEATQAVIAFGFDEVGFHKVQISHKASNTASKRVIDKCGFPYEGRLRDYFYVDGAYEDRLYYAILQAEYERS